jgi:hypothetical protein
MTLLHSVDVLVVTHHLLQLVTCIVLSEKQPAPSDGYTTIDDHVTALAQVAKEALDGGVAVEAVAVCEVVCASF